MPRHEVCLLLKSGFRPSLSEISTDQTAYSLSSHFTSSLALLKMLYHLSLFICDCVRTKIQIMNQSVLAWTIHVWAYCQWLSYLCSSGPISLISDRTVAAAHASGYTKVSAIIYHEYLSYDTEFLLTCDLLVWGLFKRALLTHSLLV